MSGYWMPKPSKKTSPSLPSTEETLSRIADSLERLVDILEKKHEVSEEEPQQYFFKVSYRMYLTSFGTSGREELRKNVVFSFGLVHKLNPKTLITIDRATIFPSAHPDDDEANEHQEEAINQLQMKYQHLLHHARVDVAELVEDAEHKARTVSYSLERYKPIYEESIRIATLPKDTSKYPEVLKEYLAKFEEDADD